VVSLDTDPGGRGTLKYNRSVTLPDGILKIEGRVAGRLERHCRITRLREDVDMVSGLLRFNGAVRKDPAITAYFADQPDELQSVAVDWFTRMRRCGSDVRELMHDGLATACVGDVPFAYVGVYTAHVSVGFFHGASLPDPAGLLEGSGRYMRHVKLTPGVTIDEPALSALIAAAYRDVGMRRLFDQ
jgi:hypothetical protein